MLKFTVITSDFRYDIILCSVNFMLHALWYAHGTPISVGPIFRVSGSKNLHLDYIEKTGKYKNRELPS